MRKFLIPLAAIGVAAAPAAAHPPATDRADEIVADLPADHEIEAMTHGLDRMLGALLQLDVGPVLDAADPYRIDDGARTLGDLAGGDDPWFEDRLRSDLYGAAGDIRGMMHAFAAAAPVLARSLETLEREIEAAAGEYRRR